MARTLTFVPASSGVLIPMEQIPDDVKNEVEEVYENLSQNNGRIRATFDDKNEADLYCRQVASYCSQRTPVLRFRRSPTRDLPENVVDFRITLDLPANGAKRSGKESK